MTRAESLRPEISLWHLIAVELRKQRELRGISAASLAAEIGVDRSSVARYESGDVQLPYTRAVEIDRLWGTQFSNLVKHAKVARDLDWWDTYKDHESRAHLIRAYEPSVIPGLLQTEAYARAMFVAGRRAPVEEAVAERLARQEVLTRSHRPATYHVILDPAAVMRAYGGAEVMREQLAHLLEMGDRPNVFIRVVSDHVVGYGGLGDGFSLIYTQRGDLCSSTGRISLDPSDIQEQGVRYEQIGASSLSVEASRQFITTILEETT